MGLSGRRVRFGIAARNAASSRRPASHAWPSSAAVGRGPTAVVAHFAVFAGDRSPRPNESSLRIRFPRLAWRSLRAFPSPFNSFRRMSMPTSPRFAKRPPPTLPFPSRYGW